LLHRASYSGTLVGCVMVLAACGSADGTLSGVTGNKTSFLAFSKCMRSHGVPDFPDPSAGGGIKIAVGSNVNFASPAFKTAQSECRSRLPGGGPPQGVSEQQKEQLFRTSACMRAHGVTGFPDPTTEQPTNPQAYSIAVGIGGPSGGLFLLVPKTIDANSPAFKSAAKTCGFH
jgi:hypothetical protein